MQKVGGLVLLVLGNKRSDACQHDLDFLFLALRDTLADLQKRFAKESNPPPWQTFTVKNVFEPGNLHYIQKVFEGAFEVKLPWLVIFVVENRLRS